MNLKKYELSILIPARQEQFLAKTVEDILSNKNDFTEIIVVLDGAWADPPIESHQDLTIVYNHVSVGQRAATNQACKLSSAKYVAKTDAHCSFDKDFDKKLIDGFKEVGDNVVMVPVMRNLWAFDWKCMTEGTMIVTPNGLKKVEEIKEGEYIISGDGKPRKVLSKMIKSCNKQVVRIKPYHLPAIELTEDHLVKVYPYEQKSHCLKRLTVSKKAEWVRADKLKDGKYKMIYPFSNEEVESKILEGKTNKKDLARFLGYFMAEGNFYHKNKDGEYFKMTLCFNQDEEHIVDDIEKIIGDNFTNRYGKRVKVSRFKKTDPRTGWKYMRVNIYSQEATRFFRKLVIGETSINKHFSSEVLTWPKELQRELFKGMLEGDGWIGLNRKNLVTTYGTSSKQLAHQVFNLMLRLGYRPGVSEIVNNSGLSKNSKNPAYRLSSYTDMDMSNCKGEIIGNEYVVSIYSVKKVEYDGDVYDLEIEGLPEILTEGGIIHNCTKCGKRWYQGPTPTECKEDNFNGTGKKCDSKKFTKKMIWKGKSNPQSTSFCFDSEPHFQYFNEWKDTEIYKEQKKTGYTESMSLQGSFFMCTREKYWELNICDENFGSWGSQGIEISMKFALSGGKVICNHHTWYAHLFRTQGGDFSFPYPQRQSKINEAKKKAKTMFFENKWEKQIYPLSKIIEKYFPIKGWSEEDYKRLKDGEKQVERSGIYSIKNKVNNKVYVGSATNLSRRFGEHMRMFRRNKHENDHLQKSWNKYGEANFIFNIEYFCKETDLVLFEQKFIDEYREKIGWENMYNINPVAKLIRI